MTRFVIKPLDRKALLEAINAACPTEIVGPILIVDDDPQVCELYQDVLAKGLPDYPVRMANDGASALSIMAQETPSLVILDLMMPEVDGFDVLDQMRADPKIRRVPVLIMSSKVLTLDDVKRLEQHALVTFQSKGILSEAEIITSLHRALFGTDTLPRHTSALVKRAVAYLHQHYDRPLSRWEVAEAIGVSEDYLSRMFNRELGLSLWEYLNRYRIGRAKELLRHTNDNIRMVARQVGFKDQAYFSRVFRKLAGVPPNMFREQLES
jgi:YesN/AraC family two-component response regulator